MSAAGIDWEQLPDAVVEAFIERLHLVEMLLDPLLPEADKRAEQRRYQQQHGVGERTIRGYLHRYRKRGPRSLLFYRPRPTSARVHDAALRAKLLELIDELPTRSVPQLRKLIAADAKLGAKLARISDRTLYRFLTDHGLTMSVRYRLLADDSRTSFRSFEAPHTLALVQADARDGIWCKIRCKKATDPFLGSQPSGNKKPPVRREKANLRLLPDGAWSDPRLRSPNPYRREKHGTQEDQRGQNQRGHPLRGDHRTQ